MQNQPTTDAQDLIDQAKAAYLKPLAAKQAAKKEADAQEKQLRAKAMERYEDLQRAALSTLSEKLLGIRLEANGDDRGGVTYSLGNDLYLFAKPKNAYLLLDDLRKADPDTAVTLDLDRWVLALLDRTHETVDAWLYVDDMENLGKHLVGLERQRRQRQEDEADRREWEAEQAEQKRKYEEAEQRRRHEHNARPFAFLTEYEMNKTERPFQAYGPPGYDKDGEEMVIFVVFTDVKPLSERELPNEEEN